MGYGSPTTNERSDVMSEIKKVDFHQPVWIWGKTDPETFDVNRFKRELILEGDVDYHIFNIDEDKISVDLEYFFRFDEGVLIFMNVENIEKDDLKYLFDKIKDLEFTSKYKIVVFCADHNIILPFDVKNIVYEINLQSNIQKRKVTIQHYDIVGSKAGVDQKLSKEETYEEGTPEYDEWMKKKRKED
jgi:hypothetical protein